MTVGAELDEVEVRLHGQRLERHAAAVPGLAEVAPDLVAVGRDGSLDPLDPADRASLAGEAGEHAAPGGLPRLLLGPVEEPERGDPDGERRGVRPRAAIFDDADRLAAQRRGEQLETRRRCRERDDRLRPALAHAGLRRRGEVAIAAARPSRR